MAEDEGGLGEQYPNMLSRGMHGNSSTGDLPVAVGGRHVQEEGRRRARSLMEGAGRGERPAPLAAGEGPSSLGMVGRGERDAVESGEGDVEKGFQSRLLDEDPVQFFELHGDGLTWWDRDPEGSRIPGFMERLVKYPSNKLNATFYEEHLVNGKLDLHDTGVDAGDLEKIVFFLMTTDKAVERVSLSMNNLRDHGLKILMAQCFWRKTPELEVLHLEACELGPESAYVLKECLLQPDCPIRKLILPRNHIGDDGAYCLSQALREDSCRLTLLNVANNNISFLGSVSFLSALRKNERMRFINLEGNDPLAEDILDQFVELFEERASCEVFQLPGLELYREAMTTRPHNRATACRGKFGRGLDCDCCSCEGKQQQQHRSALKRVHSFGSV